MAVPKRRWSKSRTNKRRAHKKLASPILSLCPQCNEPKLPHRVCSHCGTYKGEEIFKEEES